MKKALKGISALVILTATAFAFALLAGFTPNQIGQIIALSWNERISPIEAAQRISQHGDILGVWDIRLQNEHLGFQSVGNAHREISVDATMRLMMREDRLVGELQTDEGLLYEIQVEQSGDSIILEVQHMKIQSYALSLRGRLSAGSMSGTYASRTRLHDLLGVDLQISHSQFTSGGDVILPAKGDWTAQKR